MPQVNMLEAKTNLSKLVEAVETGKESEIVLARNGRPVARIVPVQPLAVNMSKRLGIADGEFEGFDFDAFEALDEVIWRGFSEDQAKLSPTKASRRRKGNK